MTKRVWLAAVGVLAVGVAAAAGPPPLTRPAPVPAATAARPGTRLPTPGRAPLALEPRQAENERLSASMLSLYTPPACVAGVPFADITCTTPYDAWIEQFARDGITGGCGGGNYCPSTAVTRDQMAVFIERAMRGTANWPPRTVLVHAVLNSDGSVNETASGQALLTGVASIPTSGAGAPTANDHWLVKVGPGAFDLGTSHVLLNGYVDLEGSGIDTTLIMSTADNWGTIETAGAVSVQDVSIYNTCAGADAEAVRPSGSTMTLRRVKLFAGGASSANWAIVTAVSVDIQDSTLLAVGAGSAAVRTDGTSATVWIRNSFLYGSQNSFDNSVAVYLATTMVFGPFLNWSPGSFHCFANFDTNLAPVTCP